MSYSSLYLVDYDYKFSKKIDYSNSWLFNPVIADVLSEKYLGRDPETGYIRHVFGYNGAEIWGKLNQIMNESSNMDDRICWEVANQGVFDSKDKFAVADAIRIFAEINIDYDENALAIPHIRNRFKEIADDIEAIPRTQIKMFICKGTSVDSTVDDLFCKWDSKEEQHISTSLLDTEEQFEIVLMEDGKITGFCKGSEWQKNIVLHNHPSVDCAEADNAAVAENTALN